MTDTNYLYEYFLENSAESEKEADKEIECKENEDK